MNSKLLISSFALCSLLLVSCNRTNENYNEESQPNTNLDDNNLDDNNLDENKPNIDNENNVFNSIEIYNESIEKMKTLNYVQEGGGSSIVDAGITHSYLTIYDYFQHTESETYFEKISNGDSVNILITKIPTAYARRVYINKDYAIRSDTSTVERWKEEAGKVFVPESDWGETQETTLEKVNEDFGRNESSYLNFIINDKSVTKDSYSCIQETNGDYVLSFDLVMDKASSGVNSLGCTGYKEQVKTMSGKELVAINSIHIDIVLNENKTVKEYSTKENYVVSAGPIKADVTNTLSYTFKYFDDGDLVVKTF